MASSSTNPSISVTVDYWAQLRDASGSASEIVQLPPSCTVAQLLTQLAERHGERLRSLLLDEAGRPRRSNLIMMADRVVARPDSQELTDGVTVALLSPLAGG
jgi:molybdopterin converting factor small subunit